MGLLDDAREWEELERENLKKIRGHRNRRAEWRNRMAVIRARNVALGVVVIALTALFVVANDYDATVALFTIPGALLLMNEKSY